MSSITLPSGVEVYEGKVLVIPGVGVVVPAGDLTPAEVQALRDDVASVMNLDLGDLANVDDTGRYDGAVLRWNETEESWEPGANSTGVTVVWSPDYDPPVNPVVLQFLDALELRSHPSNPSITRVGIKMGASGSSSAVARADHTHPPTFVSRLTFNKSAAVLGAGISDLINESISGLLPHIVYDVTISGSLEVVNTNNSGRLTLHTRIGTDGTIQSLSRGASGGVWTPMTVDGARQYVTGISSLPLRFWAEYESGDPTALYTGYLTYRIAPRGGSTS